MKEKIKKLFDNNTLHGKIMRAVFVMIIVAIICAIAYVIMKKTGFWEEINSMEKIREWVLSGGVFSFLIFILLQILQTTILQIPAIFVTIAGALIFGRWPAFIMSYIAVMIGSLIMFWIGRKAGRKFLNWLVGEDTANKWIDRMSNGKYLFFLMMLFPLFPDDILCVVAGLTKMSFPFFFWTNILARGLGIACTVFFGSGAIIPFHGWGLIVWGILIVLVIILFYLSVKYKDKIDEIIKLMFKRKLKPANTVEDQEVLVNKQAVEDGKIEIEENKNIENVEKDIENTEKTQKNDKKTE
ncbi:MAG TPA: TVP38/TMEM64 family protein [Candidatus Onthoplasma faecigallinarum]|nr:TVP38/TMEM64 family protein [Candidatus Onthoplasma faecigallinarum]